MTMPEAREPQEAALKYEQKGYKFWSNQQPKSQ